jgi:protein O-GlcNAc transferase
VVEKTNWPKITLPLAERMLLTATYQTARVILEYGSGGSTVLAAQMPRTLTFSVESDQAWACELQRKFDQSDVPAPPILYPVDIGKTGRWGRPINDKKWQNFHRYALSIWIEPFFRHPDVVLIDGRLRPACFVATCLHIRKPVTVLFDDYVDRPSYHIVENLVKPVEMVGRMARFVIQPQPWPVWIHSLLSELCTTMSYPPSAGNPAMLSYDAVQSNVLKQAGLL